MWRLGSVALVLTIACAPRAATSEAPTPVAPTVSWRADEVGGGTTDVEDAPALQGRMLRAAQQKNFDVLESVMADPFESTMGSTSPADAIEMFHDPLDGELEALIDLLQSECGPSYAPDTWVCAIEEGDVYRDALLELAREDGRWRWSSYYGPGCAD